MIAAILTVHNRKQKTLACLQHLFDAVEAYNKLGTKNGAVALTVFLTDDGCTDGTADAVREAFSQQDIHMVQGTGSLYWAGGMRLAWQTAIDSGTEWDYYLLLNDDTNVFENVFDELFEADEYGFRQTGRHGLSSGITCHPGKASQVTYGGCRYVSPARTKSVLAVPTGQPQPVDLSHANVVLVHSSVVSSIGIFHRGYRHACADFDYAVRANRHGFPVMVTSAICAECECDHDTNHEEIGKLLKMTLAERKKYVDTPTHSDRDFLLFVRRTNLRRFPFTFVLRKLRVYLPSLYYRVTSMRGVYNS